MADKREPQGFLGAGLADRAGDADHLGAAASARARAASRVKPSEHVRHHQQRRVLGEPASRFVGGNDRQTGAVGEHVATKSWPSRESPLIAKNASPRPDAARVDRRVPVIIRSGSAPPTGVHPSPAPCASIGPERCTAHSYFPLQRGGKRPPCMVAERPACLGYRQSGRFRDPCRRSAAHRPFAGSVDAGESPRPDRRSRPHRARTSRLRADIGSACSLRGLSSVTMTRSAFSGSDRSHHRTLAGVAVAAAAEHHDQPAVDAQGPQRLQRLRRAHRACGRSRRRSARRRVRRRNRAGPCGALEPVERQRRASARRRWQLRARQQSARSRPGSRRPAAAARS